MTIRSLLRTAFLLTLLLVGAAIRDLMAIVVAPTAIYLTGERPASVISLFNPSAEPEEVSVEAVFGYPTTDEDGKLLLFLPDSTDDPRSSTAWIQALPRRLVVPPGERRVVRLLARPPLGTPDGEYWTRLMVTSRGQTVPVAGADSGGVQVGLDLEVRTLISVTFRKGAVDTGIEVGDFEPRIIGDSLVVRPDFIRQGKGAYIGRLDWALVDASGQEVRSWREEVAVYRAYRRRYAYDVSDLPIREYTLRLRLGTEREDIRPEDRLRTPPVERTAPVIRG